MSTFAPLQLEEQPYEALRLDILTWNLEGIAKLQRLIVDITLVVRSTCESLKTIDLAVPFSVRSRADVEGFGSNLTLSELTLPRAIEVTDDSITYPGNYEPIPRCSFNVDSYNPESGPSTPRSLLDRLSRRSAAWSIERITLESALGEDECGVIKVRYYIYQPTGLVLWKRSAFGINGAFFEARTDTGAVHRNDPLPNMIKAHGAEPAAVTISFVLRASLQLRVGAPHVEPEILDGRAWEQYLRRFTDLRREGALVAYTRPEKVDDEEGGTKEPRLFLDVSREFGLLPFGNYLRVIVVTLVVLALARWTGWVGQGHYIGIPWGHIWNNIRGVAHQIEIAVGAVIVGGASTKIKTVAHTLSGIRNLWHRFDRWFWRILWTIASGSNQN